MHVRSFKLGLRVELQTSLVETGAFVVSHYDVASPNMYLG